MLADCAELSRHFIDFFTPSLVFIKPILLQLKDSVSLMDHCETLRKDYVLNPINEAENMSLPTLKLVSNWLHKFAHYFYIPCHSLIT